MLIFAMDIGGSSIKQALIDPTNKSNPVFKRFETKYHKTSNFKDLKQLVLRLVKNVISNQVEIETVAISTTGGVNRDGIVISSGFFSGYSNISWEAIINASYKEVKHVFVINDGRASAWAEYISCTKKPEVFVHFVLGTGVGGSTIIKGELVTGDFGAAGYLGHIKVSSDQTEKCSCGRMGCVETLASGPAIVRTFKSMHGNSLQHSNLSLNDVVSAYLSGDRIAIESISSAARYLAIAISDVMNILNPGVITIGGGVVLALDHGKMNKVYLPLVIDRVKNIAHPKTLSTEIKEAKFVNDGGMIGAAVKAFSTHYE
jgi:glucokinase